MTESKWDLTKFLTDFMLGGTAGAIAKTLAAPIERVKLLLQTQDVNVRLESRKYKGIGDCFIRCIKEEGTLSLWRGNTVNVVRYFPTQALNFSFKDFYGKFNKYGHKDEKIKFFLGNLFTGGAAGATSLLFVYPLDFARTRLGVDIGRASNERQFTSTWGCLTKIFKSDGILGLYRGFNISVIGIFVYRAFYFGGYDAGKMLMFGSKEKADESNILIRFMFAQFITTSSETLAYPLDTVRRRLMMQSGRSDTIYEGTIDCFKKIYVKEGGAAFFKGNFSNIVRSIGSSLVLVLYDEFQKIFGANRKKAIA
ncbi:hypothetical protein GJ496_010974 [Pomphorhynchus laevis]|nr:hypothetical protein GJ496_010974 [Pomphorhynchus laevis]